MSFAFTDGRGFSLVETLIATFIFALVSAMGVALISNYQSSRLGLMSADERLVQLDTARAILRNDFFSAINRPVRSEFGDPLNAFEGGDHMLDNVRLRMVRNGDAGARLNGTMSTLRRIDYLLENNSLVRRSYAQTDTVTGGNFSDQILVDNVESMNLRYAADGIWSEEWGTAPAVNALPRLTELSVQFTNGQSLRLTFLVGATS